MRFEWKARIIDSAGWWFINWTNLGLDISTSTSYRLRKKKKKKERFSKTLSCGGSSLHVWHTVRNNQRASDKNSNSSTRHHAATYLRGVSRLVEIRVLIRGQPSRRQNDLWLVARCRQTVPVCGGPRPWSIKKSKGTRDREQGPVELRAGETRHTVQRFTGELMDHRFIRSTRFFSTSVSCSAATGNRNRLRSALMSPVPTFLRRSAHVSKVRFFSRRWNSTHFSRDSSNHGFHGRTARRRRPQTYPKLGAPSLPPNCVFTVFIWRNPCTVRSMIILRIFAN